MNRFFVYNTNDYQAEFTPGLYFRIYILLGSVYKVKSNLFECFCKLHSQPLSTNIEVKYVLVKRKNRIVFLLTTVHLIYICMSHVYVLFKRKIMKQYIVF